MIDPALPSEVEIADRTLDDSRWIVTAGAAEQPTTYHLYDRSSGDITELFATRPELKVYRLAPVRGQVIRARDEKACRRILTEHVAGNLFEDEAVVRLVVIERADHIITIRPGVGARRVHLEAGGFRKAHHVEPVPRPTLTVAR